VARRRDVVPSMTTPPVRVLLLGGGRFGRVHLQEWQRLAAAGEIVLAGVVVRSQASRDEIHARYGVTAYAGLDSALLGDVDAVDIVTPPETHAALVETCIAHAHVLVEKPLATDPADANRLCELAAESSRVLMVGHIYRYHPVVRRLRELVAAVGRRPTAIYGEMVNPSTDRAGRDEAGLEFLHLFDIIDYLFGDEPEICRGVRRNGVNQVSLRYPGDMKAVLKVGWAGERRVRRLEFVYDDRNIVCDLAANSLLTTSVASQFEKEFFPLRPEALRNELQDFLLCVCEAEVRACRAEAKIGARMVDIGVRARPSVPRAKPRVAVVGGGIFGAVAAIELGRFCDVTVFERHGELMTEASYLNQWRHHAGFHYPRSYDQIQEIKAARGAFEAQYGEAIMRWYPAYFCTSISAVEIPAERYLAACISNGLNFSVEDAPADVLDRSQVSLCLKVDEGVYDYELLQRLVRDRLLANSGIALCLGTEVIDAEIVADAVKRITVRRDEGIDTQDFDYLVNTTYANRNLIASWCGFPVESLRFYSDEILVLRLPIEQICVSIMDGPFTSLVGMGTDGLFMLSQPLNGGFRAVVTDDGLPPAPRSMRSNRDNMLASAARYLPILKQAEVVESRFTLRAVPALTKDFDARPTVVTDHGFGCWSVLGGKILTCVNNAREIADAIRAESVALP
jgi:predicted dehydrogenase